VIDPTPNRRHERFMPRSRALCRKQGYAAWLYVMSCEDRPSLVKVGLSIDPVRRAFEVRKRRKRGAILPIVEYGKLVSDAVEQERKTHELLKRYRVRGGEWFRCPIATAIKAILCVAMAADEAGAIKTRDEWIQEQARALIIIWRANRCIPTAMRPTVDRSRQDAKNEAREEAGAPRYRRRFYERSREASYAGCAGGLITYSGK
jgi:hypothetical protein